ncbi:MAG: histidine phosphatase family protein [Spirochaetaceae bacterium]|nr:MAG: histidine phosphatase family protein [Spirochaetaceae bacterium]
MTLYLMRHAESTANSAGILAGRFDAPLSDAGTLAAQDVATALSRRATFSRVISSSLLRARQTALAVCERIGLRLETDDRLAEQDLGVFNGCRHDVARDDPRYETRMGERWNWTPPNGESYAMVYDRVASFFADLAESDSSDGSVLIVSHAITMRLIRACLQNTAPSYPTSVASNGEIWRTSFVRPGVACDVEVLRL